MFINAFRPFWSSSLNPQWPAYVYLWQACWTIFIKSKSTKSEDPKTNLSEVPSLAYQQLQTLVLHTQPAHLTGKRDSPMKEIDHVQCLYLLHCLPQTRYILTVEINSTPQQNDVHHPWLNFCLRGKKCVTL